MPELPDIDLYVEQLDKRIRGKRLLTVRVSKPFLLRSFDPPLSNADGRVVTEVRRIGKRVAIKLDPDNWLVLHLMVAGRLHWRTEPPKIGARNQLASFDFDCGSLLLTEAGHKKRASLYLVVGDHELKAHDPGGIEPLECEFESFKMRLCSENRTLKRALTNPHMFSGIGNAYSDEILHAARLSPITLTSKLSADDCRKLYSAMRSVLRQWCDKLRDECGDEFPDNVTAFRPDMAVHGKFGMPCPVCDAPVQRIRYKSNETNYCARCQNGGRILADRSLSRLLKDNWPTALD